MPGLLNKVGKELTRHRPLELSSLRKALVPAGELTLGLAAIASWASGVGIVGGIAGIAGLSALGIRRAVVSRRDRLTDRDLEPGSEDSEKAGDAGRDLAAAAVYAPLPFLILPTAGYLIGLGEPGLGLAGLLAGCAAFLPPALLAKEGILKIVEERGKDPEMVGSSEKGPRALPGTG